MDTEDSNKHYEFAINLSVEALKSLFLVNGGAAVALIALTDKTNSRHDYSISVIIFGMGALFAVFAMLSGYRSQLSYANSRFHAERAEYVDVNMQHTSHARWQKVTIVACFCSLAAGAAGMGLAFVAAKS